MNKNKYKKDIAKGIIEARKGRKLTQAELAKFLNISQQRLSEIERGEGSLSAEKLIDILTFFNLPLEFFLPKKTTVDEEANLQNALARLGARHLRENPNIVVLEKYNNPNAVIIDALIQHPSPRLVTAVVPVLVRNAEKIRWGQIEKKLFELGYENRWWWLVEGTLSALNERLQDPLLSRETRALYKKVYDVFLYPYLFKSHVQNKKLNQVEDKFDSNINSQKTLKQVKAQSDDIAKKWNLITRIKKQDLLDALAQSELYD